MQPLKLPMIKKSHDSFDLIYIINSLLPCIQIVSLHVTIIYFSKIKNLNKMFVYIYIRVNIK